MVIAGCVVGRLVVGDSVDVVYGVVDLDVVVDCVMVVDTVVDGDNVVNSFDKNRKLSMATASSVSVPQ